MPIGAHMSSAVPYLLQGLALATAGIACVVDVRSRRIPNALTFGAAACALALHAALGGMPGALHGLAGWGTGLAVLLPFFVVRGLGGGDVKLLAAFGACVGAGTVVWVALYGMAAGGVMAMAMAARHGLVGRTVGNVGLLLTHWRVAGVGPVQGLTLEDSRSLRLAYALPLSCGLMVALWWRQ
jgi:prepilin peptidase CpaA